MLIKGKKFNNDGRQFVIKAEAERALGGTAMKKLSILVVILLMVGCTKLIPTKKLGSESYKDLGSNVKDCPGKVFPFAEGRSCASGEYDNFTIRRLTDFGERPVWSPDGKKVAFMEKEFGDAYEYDMETGKIECVTCNFEHDGFLRVHYMKDGDYLFVGPEKSGNEVLSRVFRNGFWWMPADGSRAPKWLGEVHHEGVAVSRESRLIAYTDTWQNRPVGRFLRSEMYVAELTTDGEIVRKRSVLKSKQLIEAQDFLPGDESIIFARYTPNYEVFGVDISTGKVTNYSRSKASEEPEGIFPDGGFVLVECDRHLGKRGDFDIDIYMLRLDGSGEDMRRLTHFSDTPGQKATNPVVSPEGCRIAFMMARKSENKGRLTGEGLGIFLLEFYECAGD